MRTFHRTIRFKAFGLFVFLILFAGAGANAQQASCANGFNAQPWVEDFQQLTAEMSAHYANLEYAVRERHMDLPALRKETETKLNQSCNESDGRKALESFFKAFGDGHLVLDWPQPAAATNAEANPPEASSLCTRLDYKKFGIKPGIEFSSFPQFSSIGGADAEWFPAGILRLSDSAKLGVLRMPIFSEHAYPDACEQTVRELHLADSAKCDEACDDTIERETANRLTAVVVRRFEQLRAAGATAILVDITRNGGGSNWVEPLPRVFSSAPLHEARFGILKHEHWTKQLKEQLADVETDLKKGSDPKDVLAEVATRLRSGITRSQEPCDRSQVWTDGTLTCTLVMDDVLTNGGLLPYAKAGSFASLKSRTDLFHPLRYTYTESPSRPRLYVLVDSGTGSAAEYFPAVLQDNGAATIIGETTAGAGCGYTDGGIPAVLKNSQAKVRMPDCIRYRKNGMDEVGGVTPDISVPWSSHDSPYQKAQKLLFVLSNTFESKQSSARTHP